MDLDRLYLPHWQFSEHHQRLIDAPAAAVLDAVEDLLRFDDPLVRAFLVPVSYTHLTLPTTS
ncbi:hypothetical protein FA328_13215, partial [Pseudomonas aeruginosa]|nr:hypothetical protein [Pseudomonas aeruginosa]